MDILFYTHLLYGYKHEKKWKKKNQEAFDLETRRCLAVHILAEHFLDVLWNQNQVIEGKSKSGDRRKIEIRCNINKNRNRSTSTKKIEIKCKINKNQNQSKGINVLIFQFSRGESIQGTNGINVPIFQLRVNWGKTECNLLFLSFNQSKNLSILEVSRLRVN